MGNQLAQYGDFGSKDKFRADRAWKMAQTGEGARLTRVAEENIGLCVVTGNPKKPYDSVVEQLAPLNPELPTSSLAELLKVTDKDYVGTTALNGEIIATASREQASWLIESAVAKGDTFSAGYNVVDVNPDFRADMARDLLDRDVNIYRTLLRPEAPFSQTLPREEVIDRALARAPQELLNYDIAVLPKEQAEAVIDTMLAKLEPNDVGSWLGQTVTGPIDEKYIPKLIEGLGTSMQSKIFEHFDHLPTGTLQLMLDNQLGSYYVTANLAKFTDEDQQAALKLAHIGDYDVLHALYSSGGEGLRVIDRQALLERVREDKMLGTVANNIENWTDGSDQALMLELINLDSNYAVYIADKLKLMPQLDKQWLVDTYRGLGCEPALNSGLMELGPLIDQKAFLAERLEKGDLSAGVLSTCIDSMVKHPEGSWDANQNELRQLTPEEAYTMLMEAGAYTAVIKNMGTTSIFGAQREAAYAQILQASGGPEALVDALISLDGLDIKPLYEHVKTLGLDNELAFNYQRFVEAGIPLEDMMPQLRAGRTGMWVLIKRYKDNPEFQAAVTFDSLVQQLFDEKRIETLADVSQYLPSELHQKVVDLAIANGHWNEICTNIKGLDIDKRAFAKAMIAEGMELSISRYPEDYYGKNFGGVGFEGLLADGAGETLLRWRHKFEDFDESKVVARLLADNRPSALVANFGRLEQPIDEAARMQLARSGGALIGRKFPELFGPITPDIAIAALEGDDPNFLKVYELCAYKVVWIDAGIRLLGPDAPGALLYASRFVHEGATDPIPAELLALGVKDRGQQGYEALRAIPGLMRERLLRDGDNPEALQGLVDLLASNLYAASGARQAVRFNESEWGQKGNEEWAKILRNHLATRAEHAPMPAGFVPSEILTIGQIDAKEFDPSKIDQDAQDRYGVLHADIEAAFALSQRTGPDKYKDILDEGRNLLESDLARLQATRNKLVEQGNDKALINIDGQLKAIQDVLRSDPNTFKRTMRDSFDMVGRLKTKGLDSVVRRIAFARAFTKSQNASDLAEHVIKAELSHDNLAAVNNLISYMINDQVYGEFFSSDTARKSFNALSDTSALRKQLTKLQQGAATGQSGLQFVPTRGVLMELSGHMADACWASKYDSIAKEFPNVTAVSMLRDPGTKNERFVGSCLLIETTDEATGEPVLVVRGINPIETYINKTKVAEFTESLFGYVKSIAGDRKVATIIDTKSGRAATNRPMLHQYLMKEYLPAHRQGEALNLPANSTFNGYELTLSNGEPAYVIN